MMRIKLAGPLRLTLTYAVLAASWIIVTDVVVAISRGVPADEWVLNVGKGLFFVLVSGLVLYRLALAMERRIRSADEERMRSARETASALERVNRLYATLARANEVALTAVDSEELCQEIGRALVDHAGMRLVWIGRVDEATKRVHAERAMGPAAGYVEGMIVSVDPECPESRGAVGQAILTQTPSVFIDIDSDPRMAPWRERARTHGIRSGAAVPLRFNGNERGALAIYSGELAFFTPDVVGLVEKLAVDLAKGLEMLEVRRRFARQVFALRESEQRWQFALEGAGDGVWDRNIATGEIIFSPRLAEILGYRPDELRGHLDAWTADLHPADAARVQAIFAACFAPRGDDTCRVEYRLRCKDGSFRWVLDRGRVVERDTFGKAVRMIGTVSDLSEFRRTNERLALLETALQATPAGVVITDQTGKVEWVNDGFNRLTGYTTAEVVGENLRLLKSGQQPPEFYQKLWRTILGGQVWNGNLVNRRKDGTDYHEHMIIAPVSHGAEGITHFVAIKQDITEQLQMEQQFLRAQRMEGIGLLAGGIAHDLNNVLAPILLSVELLRLRCQDPGEKRTLEVIEAAARRGTGVVRQVLTFARGVEGDHAPLRPRDLIRELVLMLEETFPRDIEIRRDVADDTPMVSGDATQLHQVLLNLALNARDAMPNGGMLVFAARGEEVRTKAASFVGDITPGQYVVLSVRDTGEGITREVRERIFDPFFTTKPRGKGTGLGLPTVLGIVRSHGGFIQVDSQPGHGSEFRVYLPATSSESRDSSPPIAPVVVAGNGRTVLVCDDEPPVREIAGVVLRQAGFQVVTAANGQEALEVFTARSTEIDAVLMDIMMPLMTGDRAAAEMLRANPKLPLVLMSGLMDQEAVHAALQNVGAKRPPLLRKPFTAQDLLGALGRAFEQSGELVAAPVGS